MTFHFRQCCYLFGLVKGCAIYTILTLSRAGIMQLHSEFFSFWVCKKISNCNSILNILNMPFFFFVCHNGHWIMVLKQKVYSLRHGPDLALFNLAPSKSKIKFFFCKDHGSKQFVQLLRRCDTSRDWRFSVYCHQHDYAVNFSTFQWLQKQN